MEWVSVQYALLHITQGIISSGLTRMRLNELPDWLTANPGTMITRVTRI